MMRAKTMSRSNKVTIKTFPGPIEYLLVVIEYSHILQSQKYQWHLGHLSGGIGKELIPKHSLQDCKEERWFSLDYRWNQETNNKKKRDRLYKKKKKSADKGHIEKIKIIKHLIQKTQTQAYRNYIEDIIIPKKSDTTNTCNKNN